jgi:polysaccharide pyruvyl transferase CsaB
MNNRCMLVGNYGVANLGDEALREYFLHAFPDINWTVLSAHPTQSNEVYRLPGGIRSLLTTPWWKTLRTLRTADAVVFGGGSLFTDVESVYACFLWFMHARVARMFHVPVHLAFQGIGPFESKIGEWLARSTVRHATSVSVRDRASFNRVQGWSKSIKVVQVFDPVFSAMRTQKIEDETKNVFTIIPRHNSGEILQSSIKKMISQQGAPASIRLVLMQPDDPSEQAWANAFSAMIGLPVERVPTVTLKDLMRAVAGSRLVITERFHGALAALAAGVPVEIVPQGTGDKLHELQQNIAAGFDVHAALNRIAEGEQLLRSQLES